MLIKAPKVRHEFQALGRVVRALTYPAISSEYDLTLRDINLLSTIAHVNHETRAGQPQKGKNFRPCDSFDAMQIMPGTGQAFWEECQFTESAKRLEALGLVSIKETVGKRLLVALKGEDEAETRPGMLVTLTKKGTELLDGMCGNLNKSLDLLDHEDVRKELALYR